jgi:hypothetical protein
MKKFLIALLIICLIGLLSFCVYLNVKLDKTNIAKIDNVEQNSNENNEVIESSLTGIQDFKTRVQPVEDYLNEFEKQYGHIDYIDGERFVSNGNLSKSGDNYIMTLSFISCMIYLTT